jgi:hypothetical protein
LANPTLICYDWSNAKFVHSGNGPFLLQT